MTLATLAPGYFAAASLLALAMSASLNPVTVIPGPGVRSDLGRRNFKPSPTVPSALKVALTS